MTVHILAPPELRLDGLHCREAKARGANRVREAVWELPLSVAVTTAVWVVLTAPAVALNLPEGDQAAIVTDAGTVRLELLSRRATVVLDGAG